MVTLLPLIALLGGSRRRLVWWLWLVIAVLGSILPLLTNPWFPLTMRLVHGLEITADAFFQALVLAWLLGWRNDE